ncbi:hypothetical protein [Pyxidicoccus sp. MSG2]|uniref:hypothetical protein n=1 Tax=Pyxidicoccus sp. MSG2 TaxID=2996790 RepID=UPI0022702944|nr:hypothetical protein [Pyxidicoccus sp. MSG2]MCY1019662.1 hypothetical protein [Pyxidicoccus sp. MSG2]
MAIDGGGGCGSSSGCGAESAAASASREAEAARSAEAAKATAEKAAAEKAAAEKAAAEKAAAAVMGSPAVRAACGLSSFTPAVAVPGMPCLSPSYVDPAKARAAANEAARLATARDIVQSRDRVCYTPEAREKKAKEYDNSAPKIGAPENEDWVRDLYEMGIGVFRGAGPNTPLSNTRQPGSLGGPPMQQSPPTRSIR